MNRSAPTLPGVILKTVVAHTITYFIFVILMALPVLGLLVTRPTPGG
jgi:hypothetical protein